MIAKSALVLGGLLAAMPPVALALAAATHAITQMDRSFDIKAITIAVGDSLLFTNEDPFLHQIYVNASTMNFESDEQPPGQTVTVRFPTAGTFEVRCHIHPKMSLAVTVK